MSKDPSAAILQDVSDYYSGKIREHGASARGVDWNSEASQELRFLQLLKVVDLTQESSILDYGCGYGAMLPFLMANGWKGSFTGYDVAEAMLAEARKKHGSDATFISTLPGDLSADYVVASGIFNVRMKHSDDAWLKFTEETLDRINSIAQKGFAINMLTSYSDAEFMKDYLFYADPLRFFHRCKTKYSRQVALLHDYGLFEFTILVRK